MKKGMTVLLILAVLLVTLAPAAAAQSETNTGPVRMPRMFYLRGPVVAVDYDAGKITVAPAFYFPPFPRPALLVTLKCDEHTIFMWYGRPSTMPAPAPTRPTIRDVHVGDKIAAFGIVKIGGEHLARLVLVPRPAPTTTPTPTPSAVQ